METVINRLKSKSQNCTDDKLKVELKLYNLADSLVNDAKEYLKRISQILPEFDLHDASHSQKVVENIEKLLEDKNLYNLSSYELFLLYTSAYLHDCAMAPSDWEINLLKLSEGNEQFGMTDYSIRNDLKKPLSIAGSEKLIKNIKSNLYVDYDKNVNNALFAHKSESTLIKYLAQTLVDYQTFRNGYKNNLDNVNSEKEFEEINSSIRVDFIRSTHHKRIEEYINNLSDRFYNSCDKAQWANKLAKDLAKICRAHGEDIEYVKTLDNSVSYIGEERANLQFVAMMIRLGDIIHFSYDRAPESLRTSRLFKSSYSFQQWAIKSESGINYTISDSVVTYTAYCEKPENYFKLRAYLTLVNQEIADFNKFNLQIQSNYIRFSLNCDGASYDKDKYELKEGLSFSLSQEKIVNLFMGVGLYKDKYACLRELYQNSLDACCCMLAQCKDNGQTSQGQIEFGIKEEDGHRYLYCLDNGIGMSKDIIENYLLKVGNSYYNSTDFYIKQANWNANFKPVSQFGIGMLSCFMLGDKIEIITKSSNDDYVSCCIDGPFESMYYLNTPDPTNKELIKTSGTLVRIRLTQPLYNNHINKLGLQLILGQLTLKDILLENKIWELHLYNKLNSFIVSIPDNINLTIKTDAQETHGVINKPYFFDNQSSKELIIASEDFGYINRFQEQAISFCDISSMVRHYPISIIEDGCGFTTYITIPFNDLFLNYDFQTLRNIPQMTNTGICIDGIIIQNHISQYEYFYAGLLTHSGTLNFNGNKRPKISVDRTSIIDFTEGCEKISEKIFYKFIEKAIGTINSHLKNYNIGQSSPLYNTIWKHFFESNNFAHNAFIKQYANTEYGNIHLGSILSLTKESISVKEFLDKKDLVLSDYDYRSLDSLTQKLILSKVMNATNIKLQNNELTLKFGVRDDILCNLEDGPLRSYSILKRVDDWDSQYDILSNIYPFIPARLYDCINEYESDCISDSVTQVHHYSNTTFCFFDQSPLMINRYGLYMKDSSTIKKRSCSILCFDNKRSNIYLSVINERSHKNHSNDDIYVLFVFIAPVKLNDDETVLLNESKNKEPDYYKGVTEGWSVLVTGMDFDNVIVLPGKHDRQTLVNKLSSLFWNKYRENTFKFLDGTIIIPPANE